MTQLELLPNPRSRKGIFMPSRHGHARKYGKTTSTYIAWWQMKKRCSPNQEKNKDWARYAGRGISVCERWERFENFLEDMGPKPLGPTKFVLDRINNDGNYEPENCRWADIFTSMANMSRNRKITFNGRTLTLSEWSRELDIKTSTIWLRLKHGWTVAEALTVAVGGGKHVASYSLKS